MISISTYRVVSCRVLDTFINGITTEWQTYTFDFTSFVCPFDSTKPGLDVSSITQITFIYDYNVGTVVDGLVRFDDIKFEL